MSTDAPIPSNANALADPVSGAAQLAAVGAPCVIDLPLMLQIVMLARHQRGQNDPFRDWGSVNSGRRCDGDVAVRHDRVLDPAVDAGGKEMDEFQAVQDVMLGLHICEGGGSCRFHVPCLIFGRTSSMLDNGLVTYFGAASLFAGSAVSVISRVAD